MGTGFSKATFLRYAGDLATKKGKAFPKGIPKDKFWRLLNKRHAGELSLRKPEATGSLRYNAMQEEVTAGFFSALHKVSDVKKLPTSLYC